MPTTPAAVAALEQLLNPESTPARLPAQLEPGMGLLCNNVLHDRAAFSDDDLYGRACSTGRAISMDYLKS